MYEPLTIGQATIIAIIIIAVAVIAFETIKIYIKKRLK